MKTYTISVSIEVKALPDKDRFVEQAIVESRIGQKVTIYEGREALAYYVSRFALEALANARETIGMAAPGDNVSWARTEAEAGPGMK